MAVRYHLGHTLLSSSLRAKQSRAIPAMAIFALCGFCSSHFWAFRTVLHISLRMSSIDLLSVSTASPFLEFLFQVLFIARAFRITTFAITLTLFCHDYPLSKGLNPKYIRLKYILSNQNSEFLLKHSLFEE